MPIEPTSVAETGQPDRARSAAETYHRLRMAGFSPREAGSLAGLLAGIPVVPGGWKLIEVERLLFVRALVRAGRMGS